jgi:cobalt-zinc-cadmium efflux system outer membrane protein
MIWKHLHLYGLIFIFLIAGCAAYRTSVRLPEPRPLTEDYEWYIPLAQPEKADTASYSSENPVGIITLPQALSLALLQNPELWTFSYEIRAAEARALQASLYPNPEMGIELENFAGSGAFSGIGELETTLLLGQSILLGGKRGKAVRAAALESDLAAWDYESARLDVFTQVRQAFVEVIAAQQRVALNEELVQLAEQLLQTINQRVKAGKVSPAELSRAQVRLSAQRVELVRARRELKIARQRLSAAWGSHTATFIKAAGTLDTLFSIPEQVKLRSLLRQNPGLARFETALKQRQAVIALEDAQRIPDPTISGGVKRLNGSDDNAIVAGVSIPLPLSDRNQGARQEARIRLSQTLREKQAVEVQLNTALSQAYSALQSVYNEATALRDQILPEAQKAFETINDGYLQGRFGFLDVLDAQRTLFEARGQYLRALTDFHIITAEIECLISQEINRVR